ncbi:HNH endonuclease signature motif containing protein [Diaminobutyricimonas sp. LJ205]|uniref:HNH endonuclease signature motif containing protein n=1 Tax=Diaminobutyricimonas sp. LJ205 TaxID=2683590 RepID=UPI0012F521A1|nr:HNH endonuclease signature motif containing protein [Diaminobutyricimonas sp. LJ205]
MPQIAATYEETVADLVAAVGCVPVSSAALQGLSDDVLLAVHGQFADARRMLDARATEVTGEIAARSVRENGHDGLVQRKGFGSTTKFVQQTTGTTPRDAARQVRVGVIMREHPADPDSSAPAPPPTKPWLTDAIDAVRAGWLSADALDGIERGLGEVTETISAAALMNAAAVLLQSLRQSHAAGLPADERQVFSLARSLREELDDALIAEREQFLHQQRSFRRVTGPNGLPRFILDPDVETAALLDDLYDKITSPRRGGPRFVDAAGKAWAQRVVDDPRTTDQYVHDAMVDLLRLAISTGSADTRQILGTRLPAVRVLVAAPNLESGRGPARLENSDIPVSVQTAERIICTAGALLLTVDGHGQPLKLGRKRRLFSPGQRVALAARDGGCLWPGCPVCADMTEAHHIEEWQRDEGKTDTADGVLLCRFHHLLLHNNGWQVIRRGGSYLLIPPPSEDPQQTPIPMPSKSAVLRDVMSPARNALGGRGGTRFPARAQAPAPAPAPVDVPIGARSPGESRPPSESPPPSETSLPSETPPPSETSLPSETPPPSETSPPRETSQPGGAPPPSESPPAGHHGTDAVPIASGG